MPLRPATIDDADELVRIINLAFRVERFFIDRDRIDVAEVRSLFAKGEFLVAEGGCVYIERRGDRCYLGLLSVDPAAQGTGLGRRLMQAAEERARAIGCQAMDLRVVNLRAELRAFYHRLGYQDTGTAEFTSGIATLLPCHFVNMTKALV